MTLSNQPNKEYLFNHTSEETAYLIKDYPYGRLRCQRKVWIETDPKGKKGDRFVSRTQNPKTGLWNKPKKSTYYNIGVLFKDTKGHIHWSVVSKYNDRDKIKAFVEEIGGVEKLQPGQLIMYNSLMGIRHVIYDDFGNKEKTFSIKWERNYHQTRYVELKITFNRPDGVSLKEIFEAMKTVNQDRLKEVYNNDGLVRICVRGGSMLGTVAYDSYLEYLASDTSLEEDENAL